MEGLGILLLKIALFVFASLGLIFHLLALLNPETGKKVEAKLGVELGVRKKFFPWLEDARMKLHNRLINSKLYNLLAVIFLLILLIFLAKI